MTAAQTGFRSIEMPVEIDKLGISFFFPENYSIMMTEKHLK